MPKDKKPKGAYKKSLEDARAAETRRLIWRSKLLGYDYIAIREVLVEAGLKAYSTSSISRIYHEELGRVRAESEADVDLLRQEEIARLDAQLVRLADMASFYSGLRYPADYSDVSLRGKPIPNRVADRIAAERTISTVAERRAKLLGLDSPAKTEVSIVVEDRVDLELNAMIREAEAAARKTERETDRVRSESNPE